MTGPLWTLVTIVGPLLLAAALLWAWSRNRSRAARADLGVTERATRELYRETDARDKRQDALHR